MFNPSERDAWIRRDHFVDENHSRFKFVDETFAFPVIRCPGTGAEPKAAIVGQANRFIDILYPKKHGHRPKELFALGGRFLTDLGEDGGRVVVAGKFQRMAASQNLSPG